MDELRRATRKRVRGGRGGGGVGGSPVFFKNRIKNLIAILNAVLRIF